MTVVILLLLMALALGIPVFVVEKLTRGAWKWWAHGVAGGALVIGWWAYLTYLSPVGPLSREVVLEIILGLPYFLAWQAIGTLILFIFPIRAFRGAGGPLGTVLAWALAVFSGALWFLAMYVLFVAPTVWQEWKVCLPPGVLIEEFGDVECESGPS